jgi:hypothetical protein
VVVIIESFRYLAIQFFNSRRADFAIAGNVPVRKC